MEISSDINVNLVYIKKKIHYKTSIDAIIREFNIEVRGENIRAFLAYFEGTANSAQIDEFVLQSMHLMPLESATGDVADIVEKRLISRNQLTRVTDMSAVLASINYGGCAIFVDGISCAFTADVKGWSSRGINPPMAESVIRGPQYAFNEMIRINTGLLRKLIKDENMIVENFYIGEKSQTGCNLIYIQGIVNEKILAEVKRRLNNIKVDYLFDSGELEQLLEGFTFLPTPQILSTERPDRVANNIASGKLAILVDGSPFALVLPINAFELTHTSEDGYLRFPFANLMRVMRFFAMLVALFLPGVFIAVYYYHHEALPSHLLFAIVETREQVPFSLLTEILILEIAFEFVREACIRLPGTVGQTIGIVGGLVIGQAAVEANLVSPIVIIIVALTAIGSFAIPNYFLGFSFRVMKYWYIALGALGGFLGISAGLFVHLAILCNAQSLGIPFLAPLAPRFNLGGTFFEKPIWKRESRPIFLHPKVMKMQPHYSRQWAMGDNQTIDPDENNTEVE